MDELTFEVVFNNHGFVNNYGFHLIDYLIRDSDKTWVVYGVEVINTAFLPPSTTRGNGSFSGFVGVAIKVMYDV
ncbi:MAG: hypothetical protein DLM72_00005 [Candidatus Nitrosopolaris wilkensis]|nr:MAG: hypothetical protein DLM72_00005 [Candidatus Nitrosopolaris wilkensis]